MTVGNDFSLPEGEGEPAPATPAAPPTVIVIENRNRGLAARLMPPALLLFAALAISSYQRKTPVWPLTPRPVAVASVSPQPVPVVVAAPADDRPKVTPVAEPRPLDPAPAPVAEVVSQAPRVATVAPAESLEPVRQPSPFDLDPANGLNPVEAPAANPVPDPPIPEPGPNPNPRPPDADPPPNENPMPAQNAPEPSSDDILRDIEREAEQKDANRQDLEGLKTNAQRLLLNEAISKVDTERAPFREELKELLGRMGEKAGKEIDKLSERYGKDPMPQVKVAYARLLRTAPKRQPRQAKVATMRAIGVPEPLILDQICHEFDHLINTRGGPRDEDEVRVRAARALLAIPLSPPPRKVATPAAEPGSFHGLDRKPAPQPVAGFGTRP